MPRQRRGRQVTDTDQTITEQDENPLEDHLAGDITPTPDGLAPDAPDTELTDEQKAEQVAIAAIQGFSVASPEFAAVTTPVRNRKPLQREMDKVAEQAYSDWVSADRPTAWVKIPVITYFLLPEDVADYRKMIRKACEIVVPVNYENDGTAVEPSGVRARYGKEFVLTEAMAKRAGITEEWKIGRTVLAWAAVDKRKSGKGNGDSE